MSGALNKCQQLSQKEISFTLIFHHFQQLNCCLSVDLWLDKGDFPDICILYVRVIINKRSFEPFCVCI